MVRSWKCHSRGIYETALPQVGGGGSCQRVQRGGRERNWEVCTKVEIDGLVRFTIRLAYRKSFDCWCSVHRFTRFCFVSYSRRRSIWIQDNGIGSIQRRARFCSSPELTHPHPSLNPPPATPSQTRKWTTAVTGQRR